MALAAVLAAPALSQPAPAEDLPGASAARRGRRRRAVRCRRTSPTSGRRSASTIPAAATTPGRAMTAADRLRRPVPPRGRSNIHLARLDDRQFALFVAQGRLRRPRARPRATRASIRPNAQVVPRPGAYRLDVEATSRQRRGERCWSSAKARPTFRPWARSAGARPADALRRRHGPAVRGRPQRRGHRRLRQLEASRDRRTCAPSQSSYLSPQMVGAPTSTATGGQQVPEYGSVVSERRRATGAVPRRLLDRRRRGWARPGSTPPLGLRAVPLRPLGVHRRRWAGALGRTSARPLWASALVAMDRRPRLVVHRCPGGPVYGWVPLGWGEPFRPWWNRCLVRLLGPLQQAVRGQHGRVSPERQPQRATRTGTRRTASRPSTATSLGDEPAGQPPCAPREAIAAAPVLRDRAGDAAGRQPRAARAARRRRAPARVHGDQPPGRPLHAVRDAGGNASR